MLRVGGGVVSHTKGGRVDLLREANKIQRRVKKRRKCNNERQKERVDIYIYMKQQHCTSRNTLPRTQVVHCNSYVTVCSRARYIPRVGGARGRGGGT